MVPATVSVGEAEVAAAKGRGWRSDARARATRDFIRQVEAAPLQHLGIEARRCNVGNYVNDGGE